MSHKPADSQGSAGDQHKSNGGASANPFADEQPQISEYTAQEIATLQSRLDKRLGPEYISSRPGAAGQRVHYLAAEKVIGLANEVFGFNGWSSAIKAITIDFIDENSHTGKISLGLSVVIRVTLRDGTYHEDIGYGQIENCKGKAAAFEKAKKEGTTDGLKRALRTFGNVLGNCIYDKEFLGKVTKIKVAPSKWDVDSLHRHSAFAPAKKEQVKEHTGQKSSGEDPIVAHTEGEDEFGDADFSHADFSESQYIGHPDEVTLPAESASLIPLVRSNAPIPAPGRPVEQPKPTAPPGSGGWTTPTRFPQPKVAAPLYDNRPNGPAVQRNPSHEQRPLPGQQAPDTRANSCESLPAAPQGHHGSHLSHSGPSLQQKPPPVPAQPQPQQHNPVPPQGQEPPAPIGFYSARAASVLNGPLDSAPIAPVSHFNPHSQSPSIRKTVGVDHSRSVPVKRAAMGVVGSPARTTPPRDSVLAPQAPARDFVNPNADIHRRLGAPGGSGAGSNTAGMPSPVAKVGGMNGSAYRPPTKRGPMSDANINSNPNPNPNPNSTNAGVMDGVGGANSGGGGGQASSGNAGHNLNGSAHGVKRPPLSDISNGAQPRRTDAAVAVAVAGGEDLKRQKTTAPEDVSLPQPPPPSNRPPAR